MNMVPLGSVAQIRGGGRLKLTGKDFVPRGVPAYGAGGHNGNVPTVESFDPAIILSSIGARCGKCFLPQGAWTSLANTQIIVPDPERVDIRFLWYQLNDESSWHRSGTGQPFIKPSDVKGRLVALPPLNEQRRIAAILDQADAIRAKRRSMAEDLHGFLGSYFSATLPKLESSTFALGDLCQIQGGLQVSAKRRDLPMEVPYLRVANGRRGSLNLAEIKKLKATESEINRTRLIRGDLLLVEGHANPAEVGRAALWEEQLEGPVVHQNHLIRARVVGAQVLPEYLMFWINSPQGAQHFRRAGKTTSGLNTISASVVRTAPVSVPPLEWQSKFVALRASALERQDQLRDALTQDDALFASLQSRAFKGEL